MKWYLLFRFIENDNDNENDCGWKKVDSIITQYDCAQDLIKEMFPNNNNKKTFELKEICDLFDKKLKDHGGALSIFEKHEEIAYSYEDLKCLGIIIHEMKENQQKTVTIKTYYA